MKKLFLSLIAFFALIFSCKHDMVAVGTSTTPVPVSGGGSGSGSSGNGGSSTSTSDTVCFNSQVLPLYQSYCGNTGCHNATSAKEGVVLTDYFDIMKGVRANNTTGSKYYNIIGSGMPPRSSSQMTSDQLAIIAKWINQGALNTACSGSSTCDTTQYTYTNGISQIFTTYCVGCHGSSSASAGVVLSSYTNAKAAVTAQGANFLNAINYKMTNTAQNMPPAGQLSSCQIAQITKWVNSGTPQ